MHCVYNGKFYLILIHISVYWTYYNNEILIPKRVTIWETFHVPLKNLKLLMHGCYLLIQPYLHESRHQHAMRRARGCGGRFLNTKKLDDNDPNSPSEKEPKSGTTVSTQSANSSASDRWSSNSSRNLNGPMFQGMHNGHNSSNGNMNGHGWVYELSLIWGNSFLRQIILGFGYSCFEKRCESRGRDIYAFFSPKFTLFVNEAM